VFVSSARTGLAVRNMLRRGLEVATVKAGLPRLHWHDLRHVVASALIDQGASPSYLARVLGHSSPAITLSTYAHAFAKTEPSINLSLGAPTLQRYSVQAGAGTAMSCSVTTNVDPLSSSDSTAIVPPFG
jgi:Phage integrase family